MTRVLFLAYYFPPLGGGGTPRSVKFVKHLGDFGYRPTVVTGCPDSNQFHREFRSDASQHDDLVGVDFDTIRVSGERSFLNAARGSRWFPALWWLAYRWLYEPQIPWAQAAVRALEAAAPSHDLIYCSAGPFCSLIAASEAARRTGLPWVADLRDLWTRDTLKFYPSRMHFHWESRLESRTLCTASAIIANTPRSATALKEWLPPEVADRVVMIPNGFDPDDGVSDDVEEADNRDSDTVEIVHAGTLYNAEQRTGRFLRFQPSALDHTARSLLPICEGLASLKATRPECARRFRIRLIGYVPESSVPWISRLGLSDQVVVEGSVPRRDAMQAVNGADAHLVNQVAWLDPERPMPYVPGKLYDAMASGKPIVAPTGPGDLRDLLETFPAAFVCDYRAPEAVADALQRLADYQCEPQSSELNPEFSRRRLTQRLATVFDQVVQGRVPDVGKFPWSANNADAAREAEYA